MKRFPEKMVMAVIILSCGFVMQSEPYAKPAKATQPAGAEARTKHLLRTAEVSAHIAKSAKSFAKRYERASR